MSVCPCWGLSMVLESWRCPRWSLSMLESFHCDNASVVQGWSQLEWCNLYIGEVDLSWQTAESLEPLDVG
eukprot:scaffold196041_cov19-Tisochrysis_lutea.AAC.1